MKRKKLNAQVLNTFAADALVRLAENSRDMLSIIEQIADGPEGTDCYWCGLASWYGYGHISACPVTQSKDVLKKLNVEG